MFIRKDMKANLKLWGSGSLKEETICQMRKRFVKYFPAVIYDLTALFNIAQRMTKGGLIERETIERQVEEKGEADLKCLIRELITNPIRLLTLQVTGHLKQVAIQTNVMAVPNELLTRHKSTLAKYFNSNYDLVCVWASNLWSVVFPSESEKMIAPVTRKANK
ncbi:hypothetical protein Tco_0874731, partial [Tanacetum coccineum]